MNDNASMSAIHGTITIYLLRVVVICAAVLPAGVRLAHAQAGAGDPNLAHPTQVVTVKREGYTVSGLVTHLQDAKTFKYGITLFPGNPGIMRLTEEEGQPRFEMRGNFLVCSRRHWLDEETLVIVVDAPSDQWGTFYQHFPESGGACQARTAHGFVGVERETVKAMLSWVKTGAVPPDVMR